MKRVVTLCTLILAISAWSWGQNRWNFDGYFPDSTFAKKATGVHGLAVDPEGKIWVQWYGRTDSIDTGGGTFAGTLSIHVFNPNGTQAPFSPMKVLQGAGVTDTLFALGTVATNVGLRTDITGHILVSIREKLYRVNYQTGQVMNKVFSGTGASPTITSVGVDTLGEIFVQQVFGGNPIRIYAPNFSLLGNVTDTSRGFCRTTEVSKDGNDFYSANYTLNSVYRYHSDFGSFGPYTVGPNDTLMKGFACESMVWNPTRTRLWASSGSGLNPPNLYPGVTTNYAYNTWYAWDPTNWTITDSLKWFWYNGDSANTRPRAMAFSNDGLVAYVACFGAGSYPSLERFTYGPSSVRPDPNGVPNGFVLSQNYPNPFNPSTEINFTITRSGLTTLVVYDMLGKEVATLVSENLAAGPYTASFDASRLSSGTYMYTLTSGGSRISKKMMLVK